MVTLDIEASVPKARVKLSPISFKEISNLGTYYPSKVTRLLFHIQNSLQQLNQSPLGTKIGLPLILIFFLREKGIQKEVRSKS